MRSSFGGRTKSFFIKGDQFPCKVTPDKMSVVWESGIGNKIEGNSLPMGIGSNLLIGKG